MCWHKRKSAAIRIWTEQFVTGAVCSRGGGTNKCKTTHTYTQPHSCFSISQSDTTSRRSASVSRPLNRCGLLPGKVRDAPSCMLHGAGGCLLFTRPAMRLVGLFPRVSRHPSIQRCARASSQTTSRPSPQGTVPQCKDKRNRGGKDGGAICQVRAALLSFSLLSR